MWSPAFRTAWKTRSLPYPLPAAPICEFHQPQWIPTTFQNLKEENIRSTLLKRTKKLAISLMEIIRSSNEWIGNLVRKWSVSTFYSPCAMVSLFGAHIRIIWGAITLPHFRPIQLNFGGCSPGLKVPQVTLICNQFWESMAPNQKGKRHKGVTGKVSQIRETRNHTRGYEFNERYHYLAPANCCQEGIGTHCCQVFWFVSASGYFYHEIWLFKVAK